MHCSFTPKLLAEFDRLTLLLESPDQMTRITARLITVPEFVAKHGKIVCDAMFAELQARDQGRKLKRYSAAGEVKRHL
jgi:hypothetical protein